MFDPVRQQLHLAKGPDDKYRAFKLDHIGNVFDIEREWSDFKEFRNETILEMWNEMKGLGCPPIWKRRFYGLIVRLDKKVKEFLQQTRGSTRLPATIPTAATYIPSPSTANTQRPSRTAKVPSNKSRSRGARNRTTSKSPPEKSESPDLPFDDIQTDESNETDSSSSHQSNRKESGRSKRYRKRCNAQSHSSPSPKVPAKKALTADHIQKGKTVLVDHLDTMNDGKFNIKDFRQLMTLNDLDDLHGEWYMICGGLTKVHTHTMKKKWYFTKSGNGFTLKLRERETAEDTGTDLNVLDDISSIPDGQGLNVEDPDIIGQRENDRNSNGTDLNEVAGNGGDDQEDQDADRSLESNNQLVPV